MTINVGCPQRKLSKTHQVAVEREKFPAEGINYIKIPRIRRPPFSRQFCAKILNKKWAGLKNLSYFVDNCHSITYQ